jgi:hypothetical protein
MNGLIEQQSMVHESSPELLGDPTRGFLTAEKMVSYWLDNISVLVSWMSSASEDECIGSAQISRYLFKLLPRSSSLSAYPRSTSWCEGPAIVPPRDLTTQSISQALTQNINTVPIP